MAKRVIPFTPFLSDRLPSPSPTHTRAPATAGAPPVSDPRAPRAGEGSLRNPRVGVPSLPSSARDNDISISTAVRLPGYHTSTTSS
jgi:hypothetical protein